MLSIESAIACCRRSQFSLLTLTLIYRKPITRDGFGQVGGGSLIFFFPFSPPPPRIALPPFLFPFTACPRSYKTEQTSSVTKEASCNPEAVF